MTVGEAVPLGQTPQSVGEDARGMKKDPAGHVIGRHVPFAAPTALLGLYAPNAHCCAASNEEVP